MTIIAAVITLTGAAFKGAVADSSDSLRWVNEARNVTIVRDDWGIAHIYGKTDAEPQILANPGVAADQRLGRVRAPVRRVMVRSLQQRQS